MQKVLVANRGEIAVRIIRACHDLGLATVAVYSEADAEALHVHHADEAICIGEAPSAKSYLKVSNLIAACEITGADAVHPGYGFLSENANFASICESSGLNFIGPPSKAIALLGDKAMAKATARSVKCPVIPGSDGIVSDVELGLKEARKFGFPIFIKAVAGGGGKGIRIAYSEEDFIKKFIAARTEAEVSFNNPDVYLEKMIVNPRHVEVQILGDKMGNYVYLGERDCTIQRRRQKLIEETPSPRSRLPSEKNWILCCRYRPRRQIPFGRHSRVPSRREGELYFMKSIPGFKLSTRLPKSSRNRSCPAANQDCSGRKAPLQTKRDHLQWTRLRIPDQCGRSDPQFRAISWAARTLHSSRRTTYPH